MTALPRALARCGTRTTGCWPARWRSRCSAAGLWAIAVVWQVVALGGGPGRAVTRDALSAGGMLASTLLGGALADRIPQRHILLAVALIQADHRGRGRRPVRWPARSPSGTSRRSALIGGLAMGLLLPGVLGAGAGARAAPDELLAANGLEGVVRPMLAQAAGPAVAGFLVAALSPGAALAAPRCPSLAAAGCIAALPVDPGPPRAGRRPGTSVRRAAGRCPRGLRYMVRTPWLLATLLFAVADAAGVHGAVRGARAVRDPGRRRRARPARVRCSPRSGSAAPSARSSSPRCGCPGATSRS